MFARVHLVVHARDPALFVDKETHALGPFRFRIVTSPVRESDAAIAVAEQWKRERILVCKFGVRGDVIEAGAENLDLIFIVVVLMVAEPAAFRRSARGVGRRIKP